METNKVELIGTVMMEPVFDHECYGEKFYKCVLGSTRLSEAIDEIPVLISEFLMDDTFKIGNRIRIIGQFRSYNLKSNEKAKLVLNVFVTEIYPADGEDMNEIEISGYLCKPPINRKTPLGREITDLMLAVNRINGKTDYIPSICWGRFARQASAYSVGDHINIKGRIQSRTYVKNEDNEAKSYTAYEVSISKFMESEIHKKAS